MRFAKAKILAFLSLFLFEISYACNGKIVQVIVANAAIIVGMDKKALDCSSDIDIRSVQLL